MQVEPHKSSIRAGSMWAPGEGTTVTLSQDQLAKLQERNKLLDVLENQGQQIVVVGDTSSGKSTTINFLLGYPFNFVAQGVGTRRPCVMTLTPDPEREKVQFRVRFQKHDYIDDRELTNLSDVAQLVKAVNDPKMHPEWFDCLGRPSDGQSTARDKANVRPEDAFDDTPVYVQMLHKDIDCPMRLVDVPGLTRGNRLPTQIALSYIKPDNVVILVIGKDHPNNGGFPALAAAMRQCSRTIIIQNFANSKIADNQVMENYSVIYDKMQRQDIVLYCIDYGIPYEPGLPLWQDGYDQQDWHAINATKGVDAVRKAMVEHTEMRAKQLVERFKSSHIFSNTIVPGLGAVRTKLNDFQFHDIEGHIRRLREELKKQIERKKLDLQKAVSRVKQLQFPPEWDGMLAAFAASIRKYLDATFSAVEFPEPGKNQNGPADNSLENVLWSTEEETRRVSRVAAEKGKEQEPQPSPKNSYNNYNGNYNGSPYGERYGTKERVDPASTVNMGAGVSWFSEETDKKIVELLREFSGFEADLRLACLRSWQRLVDEFTGMLAFAPMPCVQASAHDMAKMRVGSGQSGQLNFTEETVTLVVSLELQKRRGLVRPLLEHFERRMRLLVERDYRNAVAALDFHCQREMDQFYSLVGNDGTDADGTDGKISESLADTKRTLMAGVLKALLSHSDKVVSSILRGDPELDHAMEAITDPVTRRIRLKERSGIMVRVNENSATPGPLHWMLPFKFNNSGQLALRNLKYKDQKSTLKKVGFRLVGCCEKQTPDDVVGVLPEKPWNRKLLDEIGAPTEDGCPTINCCNAVNLRIFRLCTEDYEVPMSPSSPAYLYDIEVLKLLKALQFELAAAWASMWRGMLQELTNRDKIRAFVSGQQMEKLSVVALDDFETANLLRQQSWDRGHPEHDPTYEATDSVVAWLSGSRAMPVDMMTTEEEIRKAGEDAKWPDHQAYVDLLQKLKPDKVKTAFLVNKETKLAGQPSWLRLCDEFVFVILQLQMKRVSEEELSMVKASAGMMSAAGQQEMIAKLTLHRMSQLNLHSQQVFKRRFDFLYRRDIKAALSNIEGIAKGMAGFQKDGMPALEWLERQLQSYKDKVIRETLGALQQKFEGLQPFDFAILNGRFPMNSRRMRRQHFELQDDGKTVKLTNATADIKEMWTSPRYNNDLEVEASKGEGSQAGYMQLSVSGTHSAYENLQEQRERVEQIFNLPCSDPPSPGYAGGAFQELCLKFFKGIHVDAIHHCRPRLKAMMAQLYQEDHLRRALQESDALDYLKDFGGHILEKQRLKVESLRCKVATMEAVLNGDGEF